MLAPILCGQIISPVIETALSGTPRKRPLRRKPPSVTYGSWMLPIDASGELTEDEFLLLSSIDLED